MRPGCITVSLLTLTAIAGCGGGGTNSPPTTSQPPPASIQARQVWQSLLTQQRTYQTTGSSGAYVVTLNVVPQPDASDANGFYKVADVSIATSLNNAPPEIASLRVYANTTDSRAGFLMHPLTSECLEIESSEAMPVTAPLNTAGPLASGRVLLMSGNLCQNSLTVNRYTLTWSYQAVGSIPFLCITEDLYFLAELQQRTTVCVEANGNTLGARAQVTQSGPGSFQLVTTNF